MSRHSIPGIPSISRSGCVAKESWQLILQSKREQTNHEHDYAEKLIFSKPFTVHNHSKYHYDKGVTRSNGRSNSGCSDARIEAKSEYSSTLYHSCYKSKEDS